VVSAAQNAHIGLNTTPDVTSQIVGSGIGGNVISGAQETISHTSTMLTEQLSRHGDTIWYHAQNILKQWGVNPTNHNIWTLTDNILKNNNLTWNSARTLAAGTKFIVDPSLRSLF